MFFGQFRTLFAVSSLPRSRIFGRGGGGG